MEAVMTLPAGALPKKKNYAGYIVGGLILAGAVIGVFVIKGKDDLTLWNRIRSKMGASGAKDEVEQKEDEKKPDYTPPPMKSGFPLNANEKNKNVRSLQSALIKMGFAIAGAPSDYLGANTIKALKGAGYDVPLSEPDYKNIIAGKRKGGNVQSGKKAIALESGQPIKDIYQRDRVVMTTSKGSQYNVVGLQGDFVLLSDSSGGQKKWFAEKKYFTTA